MLSKRGWLVGIVVVLLVAAVLVVLSVASAQQQGGQRGQRGQRGGAMARGAFMGMPGGGGGAPVQLTVSGEYVYVVRGYTLYQFKVQGLELVAQQDLRTDEEKEAMAAQAELRRQRMEGAAAAGGAG
jgi:hypothetical protein